MLTLVLSN